MQPAARRPSVASRARAPSAGRVLPDGDRGDRGVVRVWIDLTNSPHVLVMRPVIANLRAGGHEVEVTARDFAQTLGLCRRFGIEHTAIGRHQGEGLAAKARGLASRSLELIRWARRRHFDLALGHGSNDVTVAAALLRIPCSTMFDY